MLPAPSPVDVVECVAFMLIRDAHVLAERRKLTKTLLPGAIALPGGHMESGEDPPATLAREIHEELGVTPQDAHYVCTLLERVHVNGNREFRKLHYYAVTRWVGELQTLEADELVWIALAAPLRLVPEVDRIAVAEYRRLYQP
jgi:8-oxo-dGTP diphosphatase